MRLSLLATSAALIALLLAPAVAAAMTITASVTAPAGPFLLALGGPAAGTYDCDHGSGQATEVGQTFRVPFDVSLERITLRVRPETDVAGKLVTLSFGTFSGPQDAGMDELIAAEVKALPAGLVPGKAVYLTLDLADQPLLAGRQYGFLLGFSGGSYVSDARLDVLHTGEDAYSGGQAISYGGSWSSALGDDLVVFLGGQYEIAGAPLHLLGDRFRVEVTWTTALGEAGAGVPVALTAESGYFWFFDDDNVELLVKVLDACDEPWNHYWVFMAGLTNVAVTVRVTDTVAGFEHTWTTPAGKPFPVTLDTWTFGTCSD
jgi:hypothetical protein